MRALASLQFYISVVCCECVRWQSVSGEGPVFVYKSYNINTVTDLFSASNNTVELLSPFKYCHSGIRALINVKYAE